MKQIKILVFTKNFQKWIEKFDSIMKIDYSRGISWVRKDEAMLRNELFEIHLKRRVNENCRGLAPSVIIVDMEIDYKIEREVIGPLFGHMGGYIRGESYKVINEPKRGYEEFEKLI